MIIDIRKIRQTGKDEQSFFFEYSPETELINIPDARLKLPVIVQGTVYLTGAHAAFAEGSVSFVIEGECTRCLEFTEKRIVADFAESFEENGEDCYELICDRIDLSKVVEDLIILNAPVSFLCKEDCKGLCPKCGANLNLGVCKCEK